MPGPVRMRRSVPASLRGPRALLRAWREGRLRETLGWRWLTLESRIWTLVGLAPLYRRRLLRRVAFVGVTGSGGKTTTKELIGAVLATGMSGRRTPANLTGSPYLERTILRTRPWDGFCVVEMGLGPDGAARFNTILRLIRPTVGVVTVIGTDHLSFYRSPEAIAADKGRLIESLPARGAAVLNADDPLVRDMGRRTRARVITYGTSEDATLRAQDVSVRWPERLSFTVHGGGEALEVRTQLCGSHQLPNVLAALAVGVALGIPLAEGAGAVGTVPPFEQRLSPIDHPDGFTIVRDDIKAPLWSIPPALRFVKEARARRKIVVLGTISDYAAGSGATYADVARQALEAADRVIFVGNASAKSLKARRSAGDEALQAFYSVEAAAEHLRAVVRPGDLVLLKGSAVDRLELIAAELMRPGSTAVGRGIEAPDSGGRLQVVVGLGNPGARYDGTPHNVGHRVLDLLARTLGADWARGQDAMVAGVEGDDGTAARLIVPAAAVNATGPALLAIGRRMGFGAADLILVHDDLDLPIRSVRVRTRSGDGGHRGVRSVLQAFRTDEIRRVRVGVGRPEPGQAIEEFVLTPFPPEKLADLDGAVAEAADRVLELLRRPERIRGRAGRAAGG
jgi:UDP-N-acetylmuramoyl-tripeptide--D-alanyl-D-alanine ligase